MLFTMPNTTLLLFPGLDTVRCLRKTMLRLSTKSSASLTIFSPNWLVALWVEASCTVVNKPESDFQSKHNPKFYLCSTIMHICDGVITEESKIASCSRERLWELLSPHQPSGGSEPSTWQQNYCDILQQEGKDADVQKKALLLQLWTTQVGAALIVCFISPHTNHKQPQKNGVSA